MLVAEETSQCFVLFKATFQALLDKNSRATILLATALALYEYIPPKYEIPFLGNLGGYPLL